MAAIDTLFQQTRTLFNTLRFFRGGWGRHENIHQPWLSSLHKTPLQSPPTPTLHWTPALPPLSLATFRSPAASFLPPESTHARLLYVPPHDPDPHPPLVLLLPATGDHGFLRRYVTFSHWLRCRGIASAILEGPFYGARKPAGQRGALLNYVHELPDLGRATIEEGVALIRYFRERGFGKVGVAGLSQGGLHAAMVASVCEGVSAVMGFAPHAAAPVFTEGVLKEAVDWDVLGGEGAVGRLRETLGVADIRRFPRGEGGKLVLVYGRADR